MGKDKDGFLDDRDMEEVGGHLDLLESLERLHSRARMEIREVQYLTIQADSKEHDLVQKILAVRDRLDAALVRMKPRYEEQTGTHTPLVFCVDRRRWVSPTEE
jgi:ribosome-associated translation inhibitor RaiA